MRDLIFRVLKAQNSSKSKREQRDTIKNLKNKAGLLRFSRFKQARLHDWVTMQDSFEPEANSANFSSTSHIQQQKLMISIFVSQSIFACVIIRNIEEQDSPSQNAQHTLQQEAICMKVYSLEKSKDVAKNIRSYSTSYSNTNHYSVCFMILRNIFRYCFVVSKTTIQSLTTANFPVKNLTWCITCSSRIHTKVKYTYIYLYKKCKQQVDMQWGLE